MNLISQPDNEGNQPNRPHLSTGGNEEDEKCQF